MSERKVHLRSTLGPVQEIEFTLEGEGKLCVVHSRQRVGDGVPSRGPAIVTPVSPEVAHRWLDSQMTKLARHAAKFKRVPTSEEIAESIVPTACANVFDDMDVLIDSLLAMSLSNKIPRGP